MGTLVFGGAGTEFTFEDRLLSHLKIVVSMKLSRQESFFLSWDRPGSEGSGSTSLWVSPSVPLQFRFRRSVAPALNKAWLKAMSEGSYGPRGLVLSEEPEEPPAPLSR